MSPIVILVPGEASPFRKKVASWNAKDGRFGTHAYDEQRYAKWKDLARLAASRVMGSDPPLAVAVEFKVRIYFQIPESMTQKKKRLAMLGGLRPVITPDFDNLAKACADSITGIVIRDDKFIVEATISKFYSDRPRVEMEIREVQLQLSEPQLALE